MGNTIVRHRLRPPVTPTSEAAGDAGWCRRVITPEPRGTAAVSRGPGAHGPTAVPCYHRRVSAR
jgi:hypothetical protein